MAFEGLAVVNVELNNTCNKACWICGRRKREKEHPEMKEMMSHENCVKCHVYLKFVSKMDVKNVLYRKWMVIVQRFVLRMVEAKG